MRVQPRLLALTACFCFVFVSTSKADPPPIILQFNNGEIMYFDDIDFGLPSDYVVVCFTLFSKSLR
jgi:hypothetical protein